MVPEHKCIHEEQILDHNLKIGSLETRADFKEKRIDELNEKMEKMDTKLDEIAEAVNSIKLQSTTDDKELELRLKAIETELALQKQVTKDNRDRTNQLLTVITIFFTILTFYFNFIH